MADTFSVPQPVSEPIPQPAILQLLRAATGSQHRALEARLPFLQPDLDRPTYCRLIEAYYGFHAPLERQLQRFDDDHAVNGERHKVSALLNDLSALGLSDDQIQTLPLCDELPPLSNEAQLLGILYVMEGATLGGQVLRRIIQDKLAIDAQSGGEFLDVYGRNTGRLWKAFLSRLAESEHPQDHLETVASATATFTCFQRWLDRAGVLQ